MSGRGDSFDLVDELLGDAPSSNNGSSGSQGQHTGQHGGGGSSSKNVDMMPGALAMEMADSLYVSRKKAQETGSSSGSSNQFWSQSAEDQKMTMGMNTNTQYSNQSAGGGNGSGGGGGGGSGGGGSTGGSHDGDTEMKASVKNTAFATSSPQAWKQFVCGEFSQPRLHDIAHRRDFPLTPQTFPFHPVCRDRMFAFLDEATLAQCAAVCRQWREWIMPTMSRLCSEAEDACEAAMVRERRSKGAVQSGGGMGLMDLPDERAVLSKTLLYLRNLRASCMHLDLSSADTLEKQILVKGLELCGRVRSVSLARCGRWVSSDVVRGLIKECRLAHQCGSMDLTRISFAGCFAISAAQVFELVALSPNLRHLSVSGIKDVNRSFLVSLVEKCHFGSQMECLDVRSCAKLSSKDLYDFLYACSMAQTNRFIAESRKKQQGGATLTPREVFLLRHIHSDADDVEKKKPTRFLLPFLRTLLLNYIPKIEDSLLELIGARAAALEHLELYCCGELLTDRGISALRFLDRLRHLDISQCRMVTDDGIKALFQCPDNSRKLAEFRTLMNKAKARRSSATERKNERDTGQQKQLTRELIASIPTFTPPLEYLNLYDCKLTDTSLFTLALFGTKLRFLSLYQCGKVSYKGVYSLLSSLRPLKRPSRLDIGGCPLIRKDVEVRNLRHEFPYVNI